MQTAEIIRIRLCESRKDGAPKQQPALPVYASSTIPIALAVRNDPPCSCLRAARSYLATFSIAACSRPARLETPHLHMADAAALLAKRALLRLFTFLFCPGGC